MKLKYLLASVALYSLSANAAFYLKTNDGNKLTVSKDMAMAVYTKPNGEYERYTKRRVGVEEIDNQGRPYLSVMFNNEKCAGVKNCKELMLGVKSFSDKSGGAIIIFFNANGNVVSSEDVNNNQISSD